jgi:site-specific recombinase XerD
MASLYKKPIVVTDPKTGKKVKAKSKKWWGRYRDENGQEKRVPLATDKTAAQAMLSALVKKMAYKAAGLHTGFEEHHKRKIDVHVEDFEKYLKNKGSTQGYVDRTKAQITAVLEATKVTRIVEISASRVQAYLGELRQKDFGITTVNHYLRAIKMFTRWLVRDHRTDDDRLAHLSQMNADTDRRRIRRPLSPEEFDWLLRITETAPPLHNLSGRDRAMLYLIGCYTGFRRNEIRSVCPSSFSFASDPPTLTIQAGYSKRRRQDVIPLRADLAARLSEWIAEKALPSPCDPLITSRLQRTAEMLRADLDRARLAWIKEATTEAEQEARKESQFLLETNQTGHVVDFHALRKTFITNLTRSGVAPKTAQMLARHSSIDLTMNTYTMLGVMDQAAAVEALPPIPNRKRGDEPQRLRATGTDGKLNPDQPQKKVPTMVPRGAENGAVEPAPNGLRVAPDCTEDVPKQGKRAQRKDAKNPEQNGVFRAASPRTASRCTVAEAGFEPARGYYPHRILSPVRLPISPLGPRCDFPTGLPPADVGYGNAAIARRTVGLIFFFVA